MAAFLWPVDFYPHYAAFLAPFLAMVIALPAARLHTALAGPATVGMGDGPRHAGPGQARTWLRVNPLAVAAVTLVALSLLQAHYEAGMHPAVPPAEVAAVQRLIPPGACVVSDQASSTIAINRFNSTVPGCSVMVDGVGSDYSLSGGRNGLTGAGGTPAVERLWMSAFRTAQYVWLSHMADRRIPWTPTLRAYFIAIREGRNPLYVRRAFAPADRGHMHPDWAAGVVRETPAASPLNDWRSLLTCPAFSP